MSRPFDYDLLCIGSGPAGQRAAVQAAKLGKRVAVVEKGRNYGGVCVDTGTIPSKTFREAVLAFCRMSGKASFPGFRNGKRASMQSLLAQVHEVIHFSNARNLQCQKPACACHR